MRHGIARLGLLVIVMVVAVGCSSEDDGQPVSENVARWKPGSAVVVLTADVASVAGGQPLDISGFGRRPGVISVSGDTDSLKIALSRQAALVDLAALRLDLENTPGISNVRQTVVPPVP